MRVGVYIGVVIGTLCLFASFFVSGAPQEAALAALACAFAILPYVLFRVGQADVQAARHKQLLEALKKRDE